MNILYIAYSCSPYHGSEDKIGWNVPMESAKQNRVFVITKEEQREYVEDYLRENAVENISFYYVDIPEIYKRLFTGPLYSGRLNIWNRRACKLARIICETEEIDIIHQITPLEFRSIGNYGSIPGIKFVCGPIAGGQSIPKALKSYLRPMQAGIEFLRSMTNACSKFFLKCNRKMENCDYLLFANRETENYLGQSIPVSLKTEMIVDVSVTPCDLVDQEHLGRKQQDSCRFLMIGRLVYLKGNMLLLDALAQLPDDLPCSCTIIGDGRERKMLEQKCIELGLDQKVSFCGAVPYEQVRQFYDTSDVLVFPSFREATGSVVLEAMASGVPVIAMNKFGASVILDNETGWLYDGKTKEACLRELKNVMQTCITDPKERNRKGWNARIKAEAYTWEKRAAHYQAIYDRLIDPEKK